jgi:hypothetical protein
VFGENRDARETRAFGKTERTGLASGLAILGLLFEAIGFMAYGFFFVLAPLLGLAAVVLAATTFRRRRAAGVRARAVVAVGIGSPVVVTTVLIFISFAINPPSNLVWASVAKCHSTGEIVEVRTA